MPPSFYLADHQNLFSWSIGEWMQKWCFPHIKRLKENGTLMGVFLCMHGMQSLLPWFWSRWFPHKSPKWLLTCSRSLPELHVVSPDATWWRAHLKQISALRDFIPQNMGWIFVRWNLMAQFQPTGSSRAGHGLFSSCGSPGFFPYSITYAEHHAPVA